MSMAEIIERRFVKCVKQSDNDEVTMLAGTQKTVRKIHRFETS